MRNENLVQQLEYLVALARQRHFGRAARSCNVSQPTLSTAIKRLERELGVTIVLRGRRFEGFTDEGTEVLTWAHRILGERDDLLSHVQRMKGRLTGIARIGAVPSSIPAVPLITATFLRSNPDATIRVEAMSSREIASRIACFEIDAGITYVGTETPPGCRSISLYREEFLLVAPTDHVIMKQPTIQWADAASLRMCALTTEMHYRRIIDANMASEGVLLDPAVEADTVGALFAHLHGLGLSTVVSHTWLNSFGVPEGMTTRPMADTGVRATVALTVPDRTPNSIVGEALIHAAIAADIPRMLRSTERD